MAFSMPETDMFVGGRCLYNSWPLTWEGCVQHSQRVVSLLTEYCQITFPLLRSHTEISWPLPVFPVCNKPIRYSFHSSIWVTQSQIHVTLCLSLISSCSQLGHQTQPDRWALLNNNHLLLYCRFLFYFFLPINSKQGEESDQLLPQV